LPVVITPVHPSPPPTTACPQDDEDDDDEEALKAELERIRADRAAEAEKKAAEEEARRAAAAEAELRGGNPLLGGLAGGGPVDFSVKRR
jgi:protein CWC15